MGQFTQLTATRRSASQFRYPVTDYRKAGGRDEDANCLLGGTSQLELRATRRVVKGLGRSGQWRISMGDAHRLCILLQQVTIPHMQNAVSDRSRLRIVGDHQHCLLELLVRAPQHG
jgi:hypothetical protein